MKKWGLALGGGGILGFAHLGVLEEMESRGLKPDFIAGTSAGAMIAGLYAAGVSLPGIRQQVTSMFYREDALDPLPWEAGGAISSMAFSGLLGGNLIEEALDRMCGGKRLNDAMIPLSITSVDVISGEIVVFTNLRPKVQSSALPGRTYVADARISEAIRASISVPGIFVPKRFQGRYLVDGGVRDMVPAYEVRRMGAQEVIAVDLGLHVDRPQKVSGAYGILTRSFALAARDGTLKSLKEHASLVLQPEVWDMGFPTPGKIKALVEAGRTCAAKNMERWISIIS
ncbi:MAG TPA: hypothetical protein GXX30_04625 [Firmicutes bacterium]|nr:hypothetical protein [Candidatus Fermentithermobacillaceae bacterium]